MSPRHLLIKETVGIPRALVHSYTEGDQQPPKNLWLHAYFRLAARAGLGPRRDEQADGSARTFTTTDGAALHERSS